MVRNTKLTGDHLELLNKHIYMKNLVIAIIPKVKLLIPPPLCNICSKYSFPRDNTQRNSYNTKADYNLYSTSVSY
jgi:hypothetical protein